MAKQDSVSIKITCCNQCPHFNGSERHYTGDSFETVFKWVCKKSNDKLIATMDWNDKDAPIPKWCPLRPVKKTREPKQ